MLNESVVTKKFANILLSVAKTLKEKTKTNSISSVKHNVQNFICTLLYFNIHTSFWNDLTNKSGIVLIFISQKIVVWRFDDLINNNSLNTIDNESAIVSHIWNVTQKDILFHSLPCFFHNKTSLNI